MRFTDDENGGGREPVAPSDTPPADFGRRRVAGILKRETPRNEQKRERLFEAWELIEKAMKAHRHHGPYFWDFGTRLDALVLCDWRRFYVRAGRQVGICYKLRKVKPANENGLVRTPSH